MERPTQTYLNWHRTYTFDQNVAGLNLPPRSYCFKKII